jgi:hypothetical protein
MGKVTVAVATDVRVVRWLIEKGYSCSGSRTCGTRGVHFKIPREIRTFPFFGRKVSTCPNWEVAYLAIQEPRFGAIQGKNWVLMVFGKENMVRFTKLANELVEEFKINVHVRLEAEEATYVGTPWSV